ncbi:MAG: 50S ribosomal protein L9 [Bacteroidota bacterium]
MEVILLQDVEKLGESGDVVTVKNGYGRNYLIPQKLAVIANKTNRHVVEQKLAAKEAELARRLDEFKAIAEKLAGLVIRIDAKAGTSGKIFGSVTNIQIANAVKDQAEIEIDRKKITLPEEVKMLGAYIAKADLHPDVDCSINFEVVAD